MERINKAALLLLLLASLASAAASEPRMETTVERVDVNLGQEMASSLIIRNPLDRPDTYDIGVGTVMDNGQVSARMEGDERISDRVKVELGPGETRSIQVYYTGAACPDKSCTGSATFVGTSLETDKRFTATTDLVVRRDTEVYGSPGITLLQLLVLGVLAAGLSLLWD